MFRKITPEESIFERHPQIAARYKRQAPGQAPVGITTTLDNSDATTAPANIPNPKATNSPNVNTLSPNAPTNVTPLNDNSMGTTSPDMDVSDTGTTSQNRSGLNPNISVPNTQNINNLNGSGPDNAQTQSVSNVITTSHHNNSIMYTTTQDLNIVTTTLQSQPVLPTQQGTTAAPPFVPNSNTAQPGYVITTAGSVCTHLRNKLKMNQPTCSAAHAPTN